MVEIRLWPVSEPPERRIEEGRMTRRWPALLSAAAIGFFGTGAAAQDTEAYWMSDWTKEDKAIALNLGIDAVVLGWGFTNWEYGSGGPRFQDEGWFGRDTDEGGADKLGHFYSTYLMSHLFAGQFER
jgi:hypothetical protein